MNVGLEPPQLMPPAAPVPPVIVKPSRTVFSISPLIALTTDWPSPEPLIVVCAGPAVPLTYTNLPRKLIDSLYVPGATRM